MAGYVYLVGSTVGLTKIGITADLKNRLAQLRSSSPVPLFLLGAFLDKQCEAIETELHNRYASKKTRGEWYALEIGDIKDILEDKDNVIDYKQSLGSLDWYDMFIETYKAIAYRHHLYPEVAHKIH